MLQDHRYISYEPFSRFDSLPPNIFCSFRSKDDNRFSVVDRLPRSQRDAASSLLKQITVQLDATEAAQAKRDASRPVSSRTGTAARAAAAAEEAAKQDAAAAHAKLLAEELRVVAASTKEAEAQAQADAIAAAAQFDASSGTGRARSRPSSKSHGGYWEQRESTPPAGSARDAVLARREAR